MKAWMTKGLELLKASLEPPKHELNELDWKAAPSPDKKRLTEHLSAFANQPGGGFLVFGVDSAGTPSGVGAKTVETTVNQLANLGRAGLEPPLSLDHDAIAQAAEVALEAPREDDVLHTRFRCATASLAVLKRRTLPSRSSRSDWSSARREVAFSS